jgi:hypothetical protein
MIPAAVSSAAPVTASATVAPVQLELGQIISGLVTALIDQTTLRLQTAAGLFDVTTSTTLPAGTPVTIAVQGTPQQPELIVTPVQDEANQTTPKGTSASITVTLAQGRGGHAGTPSSGNATTTVNTTNAVDATNNATPPQTAAQDETSNASATPSPQTAQANAAEIPEPTNPAATARNLSPLMQQALSAATSILRGAAATQGSLATLYANLEAVTSAPNPALPQPVLAAARQVLAMQLDTGAGDNIDASAVKTALIRSGLVSGLAETSAAAPNASSSDLGTALVALRQTLKTWLDSAASLKTVVTTPQNPAAAAPPSSRNVVPLPPYRGAPAAPQAPAAPSIPTNATPREQATRLLTQTDAAIARQTLLRIASLPDAPASGSMHSDTAPTRLVFEIPLATAQGTGVAQMAIERDGRQQGRSDSDLVWRASFSIDLEPIGPVHVRIALSGERAAVTLNAERPASAQLLSAGLPLLEAGLRNAAVEPGELRCHAGLPRVQAPGPGAFLDQAS